MTIEYENWEEEYRKIIASPYYFYTRYLVMLPENISPTTRLTEEEFNKAYEMNYLKYIKHNKESEV